MANFFLDNNTLRFSREHECRCTGSRVIMLDCGREKCMRCHQPVTREVIEIPRPVQPVVRSLVNTGLFPEPCWETSGYITLYLFDSEPATPPQMNVIPDGDRVELQIWKPQENARFKQGAPCGKTLELKNLPSWPPESIRRALRQLAEAGFLVAKQDPAIHNQQRLDLVQNFPLDDSDQSFVVNAYVIWSIDAAAEMRELQSLCRDQDRLGEWLSCTTWGHQFRRDLDLCAAAGLANYGAFLKTLQALRDDAANPDSTARKKLTLKGLRCDNDHWQYLADYAELHRSRLAQMVKAALGDDVATTNADELEMRMKHQHNISDIHDPGMGMVAFTRFVRAIDRIVRRIPADQIRYEEIIRAGR
jgi:hypothetical protein